MTVVGVGGGMMIFLAGLQGIPKELEEAARIGGATRLGIFRHVTIPLMTPVIFFQLIMGLIGGFQALVLPLLLAQSYFSRTPPRSLYLYMVYTYNQLFVYQRFGYGTALLWILFIVILVLTLMVFWTQRFWVHYEVETERQ
jgi:multiple sugar transport system permease protein